MVAAFIDTNNFMNKNKKKTIIGRRKQILCTLIEISKCNTQKNIQKLQGEEIYMKKKILKNKELLLSIRPW